jgi:hypothetical protein
MFFVHNAEAGSFRCSCHKKLDACSKEKSNCQAELDSYKSWHNVAAGFAVVFACLSFYLIKENNDLKRRNKHLQYMNLNGPGVNN